MILFLSILLTLGCLCIFLLFRNDWVYKNRIEAIRTGTFDSLPSYNKMLFRFWIWDINRFLK